MDSLHNGLTTAISFADTLVSIASGNTHVSRRQVGKAIMVGIPLAALTTELLTAAGCGENRFNFIEGTTSQESLDQQIGRHGSFGAYNFQKVGEPVKKDIWWASNDSRAMTKDLQTGDVLDLSGPFSPVLQQWQVREAAKWCSYNPQVNRDFCGEPVSTGRVVTIWQVIHMQKRNPSLKNPLKPSKMLDIETNHHPLFENVVIVIGDVYSTNTQGTQGIWIIERIELPDE